MNTRLLKGDTVAIIAPSRWATPNSARLLKSYLESKELFVITASNLHNYGSFSAGSGKERAESINSFFSDPRIKAIFAIHGGYGSAQTLPFLNYDIIKANPKPLIGISDCTALMMGIYKHTNLPAIYGFSAADIKENGFVHPDIDTFLWKNLFHEEIEINNLDVITSGYVEAEMIGGCLSVIMSLAGTNHLPDFNNKILFIEDVNEPPANVNRMMTQLQQMGVLDSISGMVFGQFEKCQSGHKYYASIEQVIQEWGIKMDKPCVINFPLGHAEKRFPITLGKKAVLDTLSKSFKINYN